MTQFEASLVVGNDPNPISTTVAVDGASLELSAAGQSLGKWPIADLDMERIFGGYRMNVEGEQAVLKLTDPEQFTEALEIATGARAAPQAKPEKKEKKPRRAKKERVETAAEDSVPVQRKARVPKKARSSKPVKEVARASTTTELEEPSPKRDKSVGWLDEKLEGGQQRFGKYLPDWLFTTGGLVVVLAILGMIIAKPVWFSVLFLVIAAVGLITSAIALLDQVVAVRIFRKGFTPIHGLIVSLVIGLVGILLGAFR